MVVQEALVNTTMRPGLPMLCRAASQIGCDITSVSVRENLCRRLETVKFGAGVWAKACSELPPRTQEVRTPSEHVLLHLNDVIDQRVRRACARNVVGSQEPCNKPRPAIRRCFGVRLLCSACATSGAVAGKRAKTVRWALPDGPGPREALASFALWC